METAPAPFPPSRPSAPVPVRLATLFALSGDERELFFPDGLPEDGTRWFRTDDAVPEAWEEELRAGRPDAVVTCWSTPPLPEGLVGQPYPRYLCHLAGSVRGVAPRAFLQRGLRVSNWGDLAARPVAEHAVLLVLASLREMGRWEWAMRGSGPEQVRRRAALETRTLEGKRVGIHGFGRIARELVRLLAPFGVTVRAWSEGVPEAALRQGGAVPAPGLAALFSGSDIVVECEALTARSAGSVGAEVLRLLPPGAVFVNVGRGPVVDEAALAALAVEGRVRVASDVFAAEPLPADSPLRAVPGALFSPHIAGPTRDLYPRCGAFALENLERFARGEAPRALVDLAAYDRST